MKKHLFKLALVAVAGLAMVGQRAHAQYVADDLLLTVYDTAISTEYTINLGLANQFMTAPAFGAEGTYASQSGPSGAAVLIGNYGADLSSIFGASWDTNSAVKWSIVGYSGNTATSTGNAGSGEYTNTLFASNSQTTPGTQSTGYARASKGTQSPPGSPIATYGGSLSSSSSAGLTPGAYSYATANGNSYVTQVSPNDATYFQNDMNSGAANMEDSMAQGPTVIGGAQGATLDLWRMTATSNVGSLNHSVVPGAGQTYVGAFTFTSSGALEFSTQPTFASVPEPSTYAFIGFGALLVVACYRRRLNRTISA